MQKSSIYGSGDRREVNPDWFTGRTWMKDVSSGIGSAGQDIYHVHFEGSSRTKLHRHSGSQVLIATSGRGSLEIFKGDGDSGSFGIKKTGTVALEPGDTVFIPAGTLHAHGSADGKAEFAHIAINNHPCGGRYVTDWYESDFSSRVSKRI